MRRLLALAALAFALASARVRLGLLSLFLVLPGPSSATEVPLIQEGGVFTVPVRINGVITLRFIIDSGASEVQIPADVALTLMRTETLTPDDFLPGEVYVLADGSEVKSPRFVIRRLEISDHVFENVAASVGSPNGHLLLGQSLLALLPAWSLDNRRHVLILADSGTTPPPPTQALTANEAVGADAPPSMWLADWGSDIRATVLSTPCTVSDFANQGYRYALMVDIPASRLGNPMEAWSITEGRAQTVQGCWFERSDSFVQAKMRRKKDGKVWEQALNLRDGSWAASRDQQFPGVGSTVKPGAIYFAGEAPPTGTDIPPEAPLCYRFNVASLEDQRTRLERKYGGSLKGVEIVANGPSRVLTAERIGEQAEIIQYRYFESPADCMAYGQARSLGRE